MGEVQERAEGDLTLAGGVPLPQTGTLPPHPHTLHPVPFPQNICHSLSLCIEELFNVCLLFPPHSSPVSSKRADLFLQPEYQANA